MAKSVAVAYALWALGGPLGLHHLYLGRDCHALLWMLTCGGFGLGWARELLRLPAYVAEANGQGGAGGAGRAGRPPAGPVRFAGQVAVGMYFGGVALVGLRSLAFFHLLVLPLSVAAGVHLVSCAGRQTSDLRRTLTAALLTAPLFYGSSLAPLPLSLTASVTAAQHRRYRPDSTPGTHRNLGPRVYRLALAWLAFSAPLGFCVFHNTAASLSYVSDCLAALLDALWFFPWLRGVLEYALLLPHRALRLLSGAGPGGGAEGGAEQAWRAVMDILLRDYSQRERRALEVLSLGEEASVEDITQRYRELVKVWHPDHNPTQEAEAHRFIQIQEAYEILLHRHKPRRHAGAR